MAGWGRLVVGAAIGAVGALYATNEEFRKQLPEGARDLPVAVRRRLRTAREAASEASARRRAEILRELEAHGGDHVGANRERLAPASAAAAPAVTPATEILSGGPAAEQVAGPVAEQQQVAGPLMDEEEAVSKDGKGTPAVRRRRSERGEE